MSNQETEDRLTTVGIRQFRLNGLEYEVEKSSPKVSLTSLLDFILEKYGIPRLSQKEFEKKLQELSK